MTTQLDEACEVLERQLLGVVLREPDLLDLVAADLSPSHFPTRQHREVWGVIHELWRDEAAIEPATVASRLAARPGKSADEAAATLEVYGDVAAGAGVQTYVDDLRQHQQRRQLHEGFLRLAQEALREKPDEVVGKAYELVEAAYDRPMRVFSAADLARVGMELRQEQWEAAQRGDPPAGIRTGFRVLDEAVAPLQAGEMFVVGAATSMGKSAFFLSMMRNMVEAGTKVGIISLEDDENLILDRLGAIYGNVPIRVLTQGDFQGQDPKNHHSDIAKVLRGYQTMSGYSFWLNAERDLSPAQVCARIRALKSRFDIDVVVVDYLQEIRDPNEKRDSRHHELSATTAALKATCQRLRIPLILGSQLVKSADDRPPARRDLKESGDIANKAEKIILLYREQPQHADVQKAEITVAKAKSYRQATINVSFRATHTHFIDKAPLPDNAGPQVMSSEEFNTFTRNTRERQRKDLE